MINSIKVIFNLILLSFLVTQPSFSQTINGFVYEKLKESDRSPMAGVNVFWKGTQKGTTTDKDGQFSLSFRGIKDTRLIISYLGYKTDTLRISNESTNYSIELHPSDVLLQQVEIKEKNNSFISKLNARQTQVITTGELQRAACCNLAESFETNASVDVSYTDAISGAKQIQLLGLSGIYSQIMTENVPLIRGLASIYGLNYIPGPWMESIQVSKGTASVVNGYESVTGQINVEYKKPENAEKFYANIYANSNLRLEANVDGSIKLNDKLSTMLAMHVDQFHNKFDRNNDSFIDLPMLETYNFFNRWDYIHPGKWVSKVGIQYLDETRNGGQLAFDKKDMSYDTTGITNGTKPYGFGIRTKRLVGFWKNGFFVKNHPNSSFGLILSGINQEQNGFYGINQYNSHERNVYANLIFNTSMKGDKHKIAAGISYMLDDYKENYMQNQLKYDFTSSDIFKLRGDSVVNFVENRTEWVPGTFVEYTLNMKKLTVIAGIRCDYDNLWGFFVTPRMHIRYKFNETTVLRASVGLGYRTANVLAENSPLFMSQRYFVFDEKLNQEKALNFGLNLTKEFRLFQRKAEIDIDAYRTSFFNQVVVDDDQSPTAVHFYNLDGKSYSNSIQIQFLSEPVKQLNVTMAFRVNDVKQTINHTLMEKPFVNLYKGLITVSYATKFNKWIFDLTGQLNGPARIPNADNMPQKLVRPGHSPVYFQLLGQVTKRFKHVDLYIGGENLTNYYQKDLIVEYFKPFHSHFDASMVWGPITGIVIYGGVRVTIK
jgi:outer membrane receptor for ferrienterochelin and colicins